ncbi:hypothetical protein GWK47_033733 [Chionoecetes opilio]|uniref:Uncharacterized protein n=1 Tax=Chionoecetes opilio TaxID=41210 RepID=A0A8J5D075_CHIOP|nr:hypothetical protein GWK47_033733 [Chionoecetes opilio]
MTMVRRAPIRIIRDSMMKHAPRQVKCSFQGSGCTALGGAKIQQVKKRVQKDCKDMEDGMLVIQGGGNELENIGCEATVKEVVEAVKAVEEKKMCVVVVGVLRRPRENTQYENLRKETNKRIF